MARIVINPTTFKNSKDALCVAFDEGFRILMEYMDFEPVSEPTDEQRKFFSDTAYANDELQLRRTILARICTLDTSVKDPTDEQLQEAVEFLDAVMESGAPQNEWEQSAVQRLRDIVAAIPPAKKAPPPGTGTPEPEETSGSVQAADKGGDTEDETKKGQPAEPTPAEEKPAEAPAGEEPAPETTTETPPDSTSEPPPDATAEPPPEETNGPSPPEETNEPPAEGNAPAGEEPKDEMGGLTIHIGATVGISDSGGKGGKRVGQTQPVRHRIEDGLHADTSNKTGGHHRIEDGLHADTSNKTGGIRRIGEPMVKELRGGLPSTHPGSISYDPRKKEPGA